MRQRFAELSAEQQRARYALMNVIVDAMPRRFEKHRMCALMNNVVGLNDVEAMAILFNAGLRPNVIAITIIIIMRNVNCA